MNRILTGVLAACAASLPLIAGASSHREAPFIAGQPKVDGTDFYMFRSYEPGPQRLRDLHRQLQAAAGRLRRPELLHAGSQGAVRDPHRQRRRCARTTSRFQFRFTNTYKNLTVNAGGKQVAVPLTNIGPVATPSGRRPQRHETLHASTLVRGDRAHAVSTQTVGECRPAAAHLRQAHRQHRQQVDPELRRPTPASFIHDINIPGCATPGRVFVGQRKDGFVVNLGETFDLVNIKYPATSSARRPKPQRPTSPTRT